MAQNGTPEKALTPRQVAALPYLVATPTIAEGARLADVGRRTLYRWMQDDEFRSRLEQLRAEAAELARTELRGLMLKSVVVLAESLEDDDPNIRLRAAQMTLTTGHKIIDVERIERRLDLIDHAMDRRDL